MDKSKPKATKKLEKNANKKKNSMFISDVKNMKENLKIKEILRNVKMNSSMRIKAPPGSKVMDNKDFNDNSDDFEESTIDEGQDQMQTNESPSATNRDVVTSSNIFENETEQSKISQIRDDDIQNTDDILEKTTEKKEIVDFNETTILEKPNDCSQSNTYVDCVPSDYVVVNVISTPQNSKEIVNVKLRDRKLSLDQTILCGRGGLSQSELDLHSIGKSPLERKSSFFRKKMDSFLKNTTEIFKRQSIGGKPQPIQRRGSMSISLQSLSGQSSPCNGHYRENMLHNQQDLRNSATSVSTIARSLSIASSLSMSPGEQLEQDSPAGSQPSLTTSQPLGDYTSNSVHSLNDTYIQDSLLKNRAISMSSGLDAPNGRLRRKASKANRVTWLASEGLTNYFKRVIQDEKSREMQMCHSYQDFSSIPEIESYGPTTDSKGRRLSYQRAVSGEDPVLPARYHDSTQRRRTFIPEHQEANYELIKRLNDFTKNGVPTLQGFCVATIPDQAFAYLMWAERKKNLEEFYSDKVIPPHEEARQAVICELVNTEADYIKHIMSLVEVFMAAAHSLQDGGFILDVDTERLFSNIPDVLNASLHFWNVTFYPMLIDAVENGVVFNTELMAPGFCEFRELFMPYEKYVNGQSKAIEYLRSLSNNSDFMTYLSWCHKQKECNRLQLSDMLVKPMQRLTKYSLILRRIIVNTDFEPDRTSLIAMETFAKNYLLDINRAIRQREELEKLDALANSVDTYEIDFKDEDMDRYFRMFAQLNLKAPMVNCLPSHSRCLIYQGDLRFKDNVKETDVRVFLLTDMLLICKKLSKGSTYTYKMIRPKYMVDKMHHFPKFSRSKELVALIFVVVDDVSSSYHCFTLSESSKEEKHHGPIKMWEHKVKEAKLTYELGVWFTRNPSRDLSEVEMDSSSDYALSFGSSTRPGKAGSEELNIEREARERVAAMLHRSMGASTEYEFSQVSMATDSFDVGQAMVSGEVSSGRGFRHPMHRTSTGGSSRNSRLSSFQQSTSAASHDEPQPGPSRIVFRAGSSVEQHVTPPQHHDEVVTSITVNVVSESESETIVPAQPPVIIFYKQFIYYYYNTHYYYILNSTSMYKGRDIIY
ncbi:unnamed protein product [Parnassius mnemosyne]|uniref:DH domain-containing protein n=1 Tax=Parnassius mnemosyne TaxID=213953 RepID=A0AAV1KZ34_9NEOP